MYTRVNSGLASAASSQALITRAAARCSGFLRRSDYIGLDDAQRIQLAVGVQSAQVLDLQAEQCRAATFAITPGEQQQGAIADIAQTVSAGGEHSLQWSAHDGRYLPRRHPSTRWALRASRKVFTPAHHVTPARIHVGTSQGGDDDGLHSGRGQQSAPSTRARPQRSCSHTNQ